jgi:hypothetical protein
MRKSVFPCALAILGAVVFLSPTAAKASLMAAYDNAVLADHPVGYFKLDETSFTVPNNRAINSTNTILVDSSGNENDGWYMRSGTSGTVSSVPGVFEGGTAVHFGGNTYARTPVSFDALPFTFEAWFRYEGTTAGTIITLVEPAGTQRYYDLQVGSVVRARTRSDAGNAVSHSGTTVVNDGEWHHVVVVFTAVGTTNTRVTIYLDGQTDTPEVSSLANKVLGSAFFDVTNISIGLTERSSPIDPFDGHIDRVAIYDYALSPERIQAHYQAGLIPEPASLSLLALGGLMLFRRRAGRS